MKVSHSNSVDKAGLATKDLQFAFKENHSTILCTAVMKEIISHYIHNGSNVYSVLLDATKAFDKVHYGKLFKLLMDRNIPPYCIRFILDSYIRQRVHTFWQGEYSDVIQTLNGVRQGGVLSAILFCIYFDELLQRLEDHSVGCHIGNEYYGALC